MMTIMVMMMEMIVIVDDDHDGHDDGDDHDCYCCCDLIITACVHLPSSREADFVSVEKTGHGLAQGTAPLPCAAHEVHSGEVWRRCGQEPRVLLQGKP